MINSAMIGGGNAYHDRQQQHQNGSRDVAIIICSTVGGMFCVGVCWCITAKLWKLYKARQYIDTIDKVQEVRICDLYKESV